LIDNVLTKGIKQFAGWINAAIDAAKELGVFLTKNSDVINDIVDLVFAITQNVVGLIASFLGVSASTTSWRGVLETVRNILGYINGLLVLYGSYVRVAANLWAGTASFIYGAARAVDTLISKIPGLREMAALISAISSAGISDSKKVSGGLTPGLAGGVGASISFGGGGVKGGAKGGGGGASKSNQVAESLAELDKIRAEDAFNELKQNLTRQEAALKDSYARRLISTDQYYKQLAAIADAESKAELQKANQELATAQKKLAAVKGQAEKIKAQAGLSKPKPGSGTAKPSRRETIRK
jgi:hypothetical protein